MTPENHADCANHLRHSMAKLGCEVTVSTLEPLVRNAYGPEHMTCPHGVTFWYEPTSEQIAQWARDGVR